MPDIELPGCTPDPLMSYLKALGILRLVSEQVDRSARAAWRNGIFVIRTANIGLDELVLFFVENYAPTPILAPWAGGSGFFGNDNRYAVNALVSSTAERMQPYRGAIETVRRILDSESITDKPADETKKRILRKYRREMSDEFVAWMDAAIVIQTEGQVFPPLLGTGGNDGRLDFTQNFMQRLVSLGLHESTDQAATRSLIIQSLAGHPTQGLASASIGQFSPGRAGGPNAAQGFSGAPLDNPWDFVLMIEGTVLLSGSVSRRMGAGQRDKAIFPFTVRANPVGFDSASEAEAAEARGEIWLPLWSRFASLGEVKNVFAEGRAELSGRQSRDGVDFSRAIAGLGVDRGVESFVRFGFLKRSGKAYLAPAIGRFDVPASRNNVGLLRDIDPWLDQLRRACREETTPARFTAALRRIDAAIYDFCRYGGEALFASILRALGNAERELATGEKFRSNERRTIRPLDGLRAEWVAAADDQSPEFELALSLAGVRDGDGRIGPLRVNLEPVSVWKESTTWAERDPGVVWKAGNLPTNLTAVLMRRMIDASRAGGGTLPVINRLAPAGLAAVSAFLDKSVDDAKIEELLWCLLCVNPVGLERSPPNDDAITPLPRAYALLKLLFVPHPIGQREHEVKVLTEAEILPLLRRGDVADACRIAMRRLRSSGFEPLPHRRSGQNNRDGEWHDTNSSVDPIRLAAALLFPIRRGAAQSLLEMMTREQKDDRDKSAETQSEGAISV